MRSSRWRSTYPDVLSIDEELRQLYRRQAKAIPQFRLQFRVAEQVQLVVLDHVRPEDLLDFLAVVEGFPNDARGRRVDDHLAQLLLYVRLKPDTTVFSLKIVTTRYARA